METFTTVDYHLHHQYLYEVDELESLTFLFNLLYDDESALSHADILDILNGFKVREEKLPWSIESEPIDSDSGGSHVGGGDVRDSNNSDQFDFYQSSTGDSLGLISSWEFNGAMDFVGSLRLNGADIGFVGALGYIGSLGNTLGLTGFSQGFTGSRRDSSRGSSSLDLNGSGLYSTGSRQSSTPRQSSTSRQSSNVNQNSTNMITDTQGIKWRPHLLSKFKLERSRVGKNSWYHDFEGSREKSLKLTNLKQFKSHTDFYKFHKFFTKLKLHINHFQLRNLVCCGSSISKGIYYPTSCFHDHNLQTVNSDYFYGAIDEDHTQYFKVNRLMPDETVLHKSESMKLDCLIDSRRLLKNSSNRISTIACTDKYLACGTYGHLEGGFILSDVQDPDNIKPLGDCSLSESITNHIIINEFDSELIVSSNDRTLRLVDLNNFATKKTIRLPFAINCASINKNNTNEIFIVGDDLNSYIIDKRIQTDNLKHGSAFKGHNDFGFSCDWSSTNENLLLTGNQDSCVKLWDRRKTEDSLFSWSGALGASSIDSGGPVRNCKFSNNGEFITWAESLDHVGVLQLEDLNECQDGLISKVQSIDFIGKCVGLSFAPIESGYGEQLIIGVNDCPLGGILSYKLESQQKTLDFDFHF